MRLDIFNNITDLRFSQQGDVKLINFPTPLGQVTLRSFKYHIFILKDDKIVYDQFCYKTSLSALWMFVSKPGIRNRLWNKIPLISLYRSCK